MHDVASESKESKVRPREAPESPKFITGGPRTTQGRQQGRKRKPQEAVQAVVGVGVKRVENLRDSCTMPYRTTGGGQDVSMRMPTGAHWPLCLRKFFESFPQNSRLSDPLVVCLCACACETSIVYQQCRLTIPFLARKRRRPAVSARTLS